MHICTGCSFSFQTKATLDEHRRSAHGSKSKVEQGDIEINKDTIIKDLRQQLTAERKAKKDANMAYESLEKEYRACETVLGVVQEENSRFKINIKDLKLEKELKEAELNKSTSNFNQPSTIDDNSNDCIECGYPFKDKDKLNTHIKKHQIPTQEIDSEQSCHICKEKLNSVTELNKHMMIKHIQYDCEHCSFQAGTKLVLSKHINLKHKNPGETPEETLRCEECREQFSANWNLNNHIRDTHGAKTECKYFQQNRCRYPQNCWKKHSDAAPKKDNQPSPESMAKFYDCNNLFNTKSEMMMHRLNFHSNKVKPCRDPDNCTFSKCWYKHSEKVITPNNDVQVEKESNFQKASDKLKPPLNPVTLIE